MCKISLIVPVYNVEDYVEECLESICGQTYLNLEIIIVNDGSCDGSRNICERYRKNDNRIIILDKQNGGLASARNAGLDIATGDYIGFVDSDDYIINTMYEKMLNIAMEKSADIVVCQKVIRSEKLSDTWDTCIQMNNIDALKKLTLGIEFGSHVCDKLFKREVFNGVRFPEGKTYEDLYTTFKVVDKVKNLVFLNANMYYYRTNMQGITQKRFDASNMNILYGNYNIRMYYENKKYYSLIKYTRMAIAKVSVSMLRKMIDTDSEILVYRKCLVKEIRKNILYFLISPYNIASKLFACATIVSYPLAQILYGMLGEKNDT